MAFVHNPLGKINNISISVFANYDTNYVKDDMISNAIRRLFRKINPCEFGDSFQFRLRLDPFDINAGGLDQRHRSSGQAHRWAFAKNPHGAVSLFQSLAFRRQPLNGRRFSIDRAF